MIYYRMSRDTTEFPPVCVATAEENFRPMLYAEMAWEETAAGIEIVKDRNHGRYGELLSSEFELKEFAWIKLQAVNI